jgi:mannosyltransferase
MDGSQLWEDELSTWWAVHLPSAEFIHLIRHVDAVLAPYYVFMRGWTGLFGDSEWSLRAPSTIAMAASAGFVTAIGKELYDEQVGLRAGLLFAVLPMAARYGQEARPYALATLASAAATWCMLRVSHRDGGSASRVGYVVALTLSGMLHVITLAIAPAHLALAVAHGERTGSGRRASARVCVMLQLTSLGLLAPVIAMGMGQRGQIHATPLSIHLPAALGVGVAGTVLLAALAAHAIVRQTERRWTLVLWALVPPLMLLLTHPVLHLFRLRYLVFTLPAWAILAAAGVRARGAWQPLAATAALTLAMVSLGLPTQSIIRSATGHAKGQCDYRSVAEELSAELATTDAVVLGGERNRSRHARLALKYYLRQQPEWRDVLAAVSMEERGEFAVENCTDPGKCVAPALGEARVVSCAEQPSRARLLEGVPDRVRSVFTTEFAVSSYRERGNVMYGLLRRLR